MFLAINRWGLAADAIYRDVAGSLISSKALEKASLRSGRDFPEWPWSRAWPAQVEEPPHRPGSEVERNPR